MRCARSTACRWRSSARPSRTRRSPTRGISFPTGRSASRKRALQSSIDEVRAKGAKAVVLLSHNGMDVDLKLAGRVRGLDAILGGHTHDAVPQPVRVGKTLVTNAGSNGKFLAVLDLQVGSCRRHRSSLPPAAGVLAAARRGPGDGGVHRGRASTVSRQSWTRTLAITEGLLYRRGNFNGSFDELILQALLQARRTRRSRSRPAFAGGPRCCRATRSRSST